MSSSPKSSVKKPLPDHSKCPPTSDCSRGALPENCCSVEAERRDDLAARRSKGKPVGSVKVSVAEVFGAPKASKVPVAPGLGCWFGKDNIPPAVFGGLGVC